MKTLLLHFVTFALGSALGYFTATKKAKRPKTREELGYVKGAWRC